MLKHWCLYGRKDTEKERRQRRPATTRGDLRGSAVLPAPCFQTSSLKNSRVSGGVLKRPGSPGGSKNPPASAGYLGSAPEDFPRGGNGSPRQYSGPGNPVDTGVWWATVHEVAQSGARLSDESTTHHKPPSWWWFAVQPWEANVSRWQGVSSPASRGKRC